MSDKPVIEYGNSIMVSVRAGDSIDSAAKAMIDASIKQATDPLRWISDLEWVEPPYLVKGPQVDQLRRFVPWGWYGKFASEGYGELRKHFACQRPHFPERITLRWALRLWWNNRKDWR